MDCTCVQILDFQMLRPSQVVPRVPAIMGTSWEQAFLPV